jgi:hypothetical protein
LSGRRCDPLEYDEGFRVDFKRGVVGGFQKSRAKNLPLYIAGV